MLERGEVSKIQSWLRKSFPGCYLLKLESPSTSGILDLYFAFDGRSAWLECKKPEYRTRAWKNKRIQEWHIKELTRNGVPARFIFSLDDAKAFILPLFVTTTPYLSIKKITIKKI